MDNVISITNVFLHGRDADYILNERLDIPIKYKLININESK